MLEDLRARVLARDRLGRVAGVCGEVLRRVAAAGLAQRREHVLGDLALVEGGAAVAGDPAQDLRLSRRAEPLAERKRTAALAEMRGRVALQELGARGQIDGDPRRDGHAFLGMADRGFENRVEAEPSVLGAQAAEPVDRAGDGDSLHAAQRHRVEAALAQAVRRNRRRGAAGSVEGGDFVGSGVADEGEAVAADPRHVRLADAEHGGGRDGGVGGVAAAAQNVDRDQRRQRMRGGAHATRRDDRGSAGQVEVAHGSLASGVRRRRMGRRPQHL